MNKSNRKRTMKDLEQTLKTASIKDMVAMLKKPQWYNYRGTILYRLEDLDWQQYYREVVPLINDPVYEVAITAYAITETLQDRFETARKAIIHELNDLLYRERDLNQYLMDVLRSDLIDKNAK